MATEAQRGQSKRILEKFSKKEVNNASEIVDVILRELERTKDAQLVIMHLNVNGIDVLKPSNVNMDDSDYSKVWQFPLLEYKDKVYSILDELGFSAVLCEDFDYGGYPRVWLIVKPK